MERSIMGAFSRVRGMVSELRLKTMEPSFLLGSGEMIGSMEKGHWLLREVVMSMYMMENGIKGTAKAMED
jgi:hypothetical protein